LLPQFRGYDIVQLINPDCFGLKAERQYPFYQYLRHHNKKMVVGAFGCDWYWVDDGIHHKTFRYGDFYIGDQKRTDFAAQKFIDDKLLTYEDHRLRLTRKGLFVSDMIMSELIWVD
jgi:hypothetical protein